MVKTPVLTVAPVRRNEVPSQGSVTGIRVRLSKSVHSTSPVRSRSCRRSDPTPVPSPLETPEVTPRGPTCVFPRPVRHPDFVPTTAGSSVSRPKSGGLPSEHTGCTPDDWSERHGLGGSGDTIPTLEEGEDSRCVVRRSQAARGRGRDSGESR